MFLELSKYILLGSNPLFNNSISLSFCSFISSCLLILYALNNTLINVITKSTLFNATAFLSTSVLSSLVF